MSANNEPVVTPRNRASRAEPARRGLRAAAGAFAFAVASTLMGRRLSTVLRDMKRAQWLPVRELQARAETRLARLLQHAATNVPFYRDVYQRLGIAPEALRTLEDLRALPVVRKAILLKEGRERILASNMSSYERADEVTSGSTGEPFEFGLDRSKLALSFAVHLFYDSWYGLQPFDRGLRIGSPGLPPPALPSDMPAVLRYTQAMSSRLHRIYVSLALKKIPLWSFDVQKALEIHQTIETFRPAYIYSGASTLASLADLLLQQNCRLQKPPEVVISSFESLTPHRRRLIEQYFRAPIVNRYGLRELGNWCAQSCPESPETFHVNTELVIMEVLRADDSPAAAGEIGRLVLTDLFNYTMPFIRYDTGDLGVLMTDSCPCGRGFPRLGPIDGRVHECIETPSGKIITPSRWSHFLFVYKKEYFELVSQYQLQWTPPDQARLLIVPSGKFDDEMRKRLRDDVAWLLGDDVSVTVETVAEIPTEKSGKRPIIKKVAPPPEVETGK